MHPIGICSPELRTPSGAVGTVVAGVARFSPALTACGWRRFLGAECTAGRVCREPGLGRPGCD